MRKRTYALLAAAGGAAIAGTALYLYNQRATPGGYSLSLAASPTSGAVPLTVVFVGAYEAGDGTPLPNVPVTLYVNGAPYDGATAVTDSAGLFQIVTTFNTSGVYDCFASAPYGLEFVLSSHLSVACSPATLVRNLSLTASTFFAGPGASIQLQALDTDSGGEGAPVQGALLALVVNGSQVATGITDGTGIVNFTYTIPATGKYLCYVRDFTGLQSSILQIVSKPKYTGIPSPVIGTAVFGGNSTPPLLVSRRTPRHNYD